MELRAAYKETEVGVIPAQWEVKRLGDLGTIVRGGSPRPAGDPRFFNGSFAPWLTVAALTNIPDSQLRVTETFGFLTEEGSKRSRTLMDGTVIIANSGATLGVAKILGITCCANDGIAAIINQRTGNKSFICYYINSQTAHLREVIATGNGQPNLNTKLIRETALPFPKEDEQRAIAAALSDVDALLLRLDQLIPKKRDLKLGAMQELLAGRRRLPGFTGRWTERRIGDVGKCLRGVTYKGDTDLSPYDTPRTRRLLRSNNVQGSTVVARDIQFVNSERVSPQQLMQVNDILICMANGSKELVGKAGAFTIEDGYLYTFGAFMGCFRTSAERADPAFVFFLFQTGRYRDYINNLLAGSSINNLRPSTIESLEFPFPSMAEQAAIAAALSDMDSEIEALKSRREKTRAIKQGMMQELLTGRIRLV